MSRFSNPRTAQAMMETHGHTNIGMPPKPGFPGAAAPVRPGVKPTVTGAPDKNLPFIIDNKPIPGTRPGVTTGGPKPAPMPMAGTRPGVTTGGPKPAPTPAPASINGLGSRFARATAVKPMKKGGKVKVSSASKRADGCAIRGKTKGKMV
jgi:hypothetical protein